jgi:hypothetical protein
MQTEDEIFMIIDFIKNNDLEKVKNNLKSHNSNPTILNWMCYYENHEMIKYFFEIFDTLNIDRHNVGVSLMCSARNKKFNSVRYLIEQSRLKKMPIKTGDIVATMDTLHEFGETDLRKFLDDELLEIMFGKNYK